jgi:ligand-binding sensor domain-containing protein/signal transduction histidine kinase
VKLFALCAGVVAALALPAARANAISPDKPPARLSIEDWQVKDGLPGDSVRAIDQAIDGRLWIATFGGLVRYDGIAFKAVAVPDELKLALADVNQVLAVRDGSVWLGSYHHGPMRFEGGTTRSFGAADGLPEGAVAEALSEDDEGHVWMASPHALWKYADDRFVARPVRDLAGVRITLLAIDAQGTPWLGTTTGLYAVVGDRLRRPDGIPITAPVTAMHIDARRVLWVAAGGELFAVEGGKVARRLDRTAGLPAVAIAHIEHDDDGNLWLASPAGLVRVREGHAGVFPLREGDPPDNVTAVKIDRERGLWLGRHAAGLVHLTDRTLDTHAGPPGLEGTEPLAVCQDDDGAMWFGTHGRGAVRWTGGRATWVTARDGLPADVVTAILPDGAGAVWLGTHEGLVRWHAGKIEHPGFWPGRVRTLYRDRQRALWIGGDGVVGRYAEGTLTTFTPREGVMGGHIRAMTEDANGVLWVSGVGGLVRRAGTGPTAGFVKATALPERPAGQVRAMLLDSEGGFWMTTGRAGLVRTLGGRSFAFDVRVGLEPDMLYGLIEDDGGDLWIGTNKSILRVSRSSLEAVAAQRHTAVQVASFETTDRRAGVIAAQLHQPSVWKERDGALWFLTSQGPVRIDPHAVHTNTTPPRVNVDAAFADGQPITPGGRARLPHPPQRLEFQYGAVTLLQPTKVRYRHWLEGHDQGWIEAGDRRVAIYGNLPAGSYRFRVQASNNDGVWNERGANFTVAIEPPFYRRIWFYLACALSLLPVAWLVHRSRLAGLRARYLGVLTERTRMARELHDTLLQGMSTVAMQLHGLANHFKAAAPAARRDFDLVRATVTQCLDETRRVVRGLREDERAQSAMGPGAGTLGVALERLAQRLRAAVVPGAAAGSGTAAICEVEVQGDPRPLPHAVQDELYRIGQEALTNALRHAEARRIELRLSYEAQLVRLVVKDDGRGFDPASVSDASLHFGIQGLRERAARIGATLDVRSRDGAGTVIETVVETGTQMTATATAKETLA